MKKILLVLGLLMWTQPVFATELDAMTDAERQAFRDEVRAYLLENPEVLMEAIQVLEQRQQQQQAQTDLDLVRENALDLFADGYSWTGGNPEGDITVVEFLDYRCGYCRRAHDQVAELISSDGNIRFIVKEFPILGEQSTISSQLAIATLQTAGADDYKRLNDVLMTFNGELNESTIPQLLGHLELDANTIVARMSSPKVAAHIADVNALAQRLQISGTPTFVIQSEMVRGYIPLEDMRNMIALLRQENN